MVLIGKLETAIFGFWSRGWDNGTMDCTNSVVSESKLSNGS